MFKRILSIPLFLMFSVVVVTLSGCAAITGVPADGGLVVNDIVVGEGMEAFAGDRVSVHYTGWLYDETKQDKKGSKFDSSLDRGRPFDFVLGTGRVIKGWDQGVAGMKVGGQRTLVIPAELGYGARGAGRSIPPNAVLVFDIELLSVR